MVLSALLFSFSVRAASDTPPPEKSAFQQALESNIPYSTKEKWVEIGGRRYREVEYKDEKYYLRTLQGSSDQAELLCDSPSGELNPKLTEVSAQVTPRTKAFIQLLEESCVSGPDGRRRIVLNLDPRLGITLPEDPKSPIKNKKIFVNPVKPGVGFSGEW